MADIAANADSGYYRSDGIQNSGTALNSKKTDVTIYSGSKKIYPRKIEQDVNIPTSTVGNCTLKTAFSEYSNWVDGAKQGYYWNGTGAWQGNGAWAPSTPRRT